MAKSSRQRRKSSRSRTEQPARDTAADPPAGEQAESASDPSVDELVDALRSGSQEEAPATDEQSAAAVAEAGEQRADRETSGEVRLERDLPIDPDDDLSEIDDGEVSPRLVAIVESLLFATSKPLRVKDIRKVLKEPSVHQIQLAVRTIQESCRDRGMVLSQVAGGFRFVTNPENAQWVQRLLAAKPARLSRSQLETLAVVAYRQPITKAEVDHVRGVDSGAVLRALLERDLVKIVGRKEEPGRPHLYGTTFAFLEFFNLRSLRDLPDLHEFQQLSDDSRDVLRSELGEDEDEIMGQQRMAFEDGTAEPAEQADSGEFVEQTASNGPAEPDEEATEASEPETDPAGEDGPRRPGDETDSQTREDG